MIKNFQKKVLSGELDRELTSKSRNTRHHTEPTRTKVDSTRAESTRVEQTKKTQATETKDLNSDLQNESQETANESDSSIGKKYEIKTEQFQQDLKEEHDVVVECIKDQALEEPIKPNSQIRPRQKRSSSIPLRHSQIEGLEECIYQIEEEDSQAIESTSSEDEYVKQKELLQDSSKNSTAAETIVDRLNATQEYLKRTFYEVVQPLFSEIKHKEQIIERRNQEEMQMVKDIKMIL